MTYNQEIGLSIVVYSSLAEGGDRIATLDTHITDYSHTISANGGFDDMSVTIVDDRLSLDEWLERGVGRHIEVYSSAGEIVWEGFVNGVSAQMGAMQAEIGPLMDVGNRVSVIYAFVDIDFSPPQVGDTTITPIAENKTSQARFGIVEKILNGGRLTDDEALWVRDTYLKESAYPATSSVISVGGTGGQVALTLDCLGYWYFLNAYAYNDTDSGTMQIDDRVKEILEANPNIGMYKSISIDTNNSIVPEESDEDKFAMAHIKELLAIGGASDQRYTLGFYANREALYREIPSKPAYKTTLSDQGQRILTYEGALVYPWEIKPAQWIYISDALIGRHTDITNYYEDPRYIFIEQVSYTSPWGVTLNGSRVGTYDQIMAKFGLGDF